MQLMTEQIHEIAIIRLPAGSLDINNARDFHKSIESILKNNKWLVLNLEDIEFVDSSGLGALLVCLRQCTTKGGDMKLCNVRQPVRILFEMVRLHRVMDILNSVEESVQEISGTRKDSVPDTVNAQESDQNAVYANS